MREERAYLHTCPTPNFSSNTAICVLCYVACDHNVASTLYMSRMNLYDVEYQLCRGNVILSLNALSALCNYPVICIIYNCLSSLVSKTLNLRYRRKNISQTATKFFVLMFASWDLFRDKKVRFAFRIGMFYYLCYENEKHGILRGNIHHVVL